MQLFYIPDIQGSQIVFDREESRHCVRVLRYREGDHVQLTDGKGTMFTGLLVSAQPDRCEVEVIRQEYHRSGTAPLHLAVAPPKNPDRFGWFLEKATEIGVDEITPLLCDRSERTTLRIPRFEKVMIAAMKQSLRCRLPKLNEPVEFRTFVRQSHPGQRFIAWCESGRETGLFRMLKPDNAIMVAIGPEGDFTPGEVSAAAENGFIPVSLGNSRLRTETAGVLVCCGVRLIHEGV